MTKSAICKALFNLCNDVNSNTGRVGSIITDLGGLTFGISGDTYGYYKNGTLVGFKSQADIDAAYQSGYNAGVAAGQTTHTGTKTITTNTTTDLGVHHTYRYIKTNVPGITSLKHKIANALSSYTDPFNGMIKYYLPDNCQRFTVNSMTTAAYASYYYTASTPQSIAISVGGSYPYKSSSRTSGWIYVNYSGNLSEFYIEITMYF